MIVLYRTILLDPQGREGWYYGIHKVDRASGLDPLWSENNPDGYIGSGGLFHNADDGHLRTLKRGWVHVRTDLIKEVASYDLDAERVLIKDAWKLYGIHPQVKAWCAAHGIVLPYKDGVVLNCQATSAENLWPSDGRTPPCNTKEALDKKSETLKRKYEEDPLYKTHLSEGIKKAHVKDPNIARRGVTTKIERYGEIPGIRKAIDLARSKAARSKAGKSRSKSAQQWVCLERPDLEHNSLRQLSLLLGLGELVVSYYSKRRGCDKFTYRELTFIKYQI